MAEWFVWPLEADVNVLLPITDLLHIVQRRTKDEDGEYQWDYVVKIQNFPRPFKCEGAEKTAAEYLWSRLTTPAATQ